MNGENIRVRDAIWPSEWENIAVHAVRAFVTNVTVLFLAWCARVNGNYTIGRGEP